MFREGCVFPVFHVHGVTQVAFLQVCFGLGGDLALWDVRFGRWRCGVGFLRGDGGFVLARVGNMRE